MPINRPMPRPAVKTPAPQPQFSRAAPRPMAKPTTPPPMGGMMGGRPAPGPKAPPAPAPAFSGNRPAQMAKPPAQPGMMGALQSRLQGARPQQKPMGQLAESNEAVRMAGPGYPVGQQLGIDTGSGREMFTKTADNYLQRPQQSMGGGDDMGGIRSQVLGATSAEQQQQALSQLRSAAGNRPEMQQLLSQARGFGLDENAVLMDPEGFQRMSQEMAMRNRDITKAGRQIPMLGNTFAVAPQRLDMTQRLNNMFVPGQRG